MEELQIKVSQQIGKIDINYEEIEANLKAALAEYQGIIVTEDSVKQAKADVAELRKKRTSIDEEKKRIKKIWNEPYAEFESRCKTLMGLVDETITPIVTQIEEFEKKSIAEKKDRLCQLYTENIGEYSDYLPFESSLGEKWQNVSYKDKDYLYDLSEKKTRIRTDIEAIRALSSEIEDDVLDAYKKSGNNLSAAIMRNNQYLSDKKRMAVQVKEQIKYEMVTEMPVDKRMIKFIVSGEDAEQVRQLLTNAGIIFGEE